MIELTEKQTHMMKHAFGFDSRHPGFRRHYCTQVDDANMKVLVDEELFEGPHEMGTVGHNCGMFYLTAKGFADVERWHRDEKALKKLEKKRNEDQLKPA